MNKPDYSAEYAASLWQFANEFYRYAKVKQRLLALQDEHQLNINELLFLLWYAMRQDAVITENQLNQLHAQGLPWQTKVTELRQFRRAFCAKLDADDVQAQVKADLLRAELTLERLHLNTLASAFATEQPLGDSHRELTSLHFLAQENIDAYVAFNGLPPDSSRRLLLDQLLADWLSLMDSSETLDS
ncbi:MAG: TIGR02444 family protein [Gammaproteobacteria bacterium]|nr:TIGR02444 family protein [Gammaproteobacteria bacterium]